jgi:hypothetical protein
MAPQGHNPIDEQLLEYYWQAVEVRSRINCYQFQEICLLDLRSRFDAIERRIKTLEQAANHQAACDELACQALEELLSAQQQSADRQAICDALADQEQADG